MRVAILDRNGYLIGVVEKDRPGKGDIDAGDLPTDGTYWFKDGVFIPRGFGKGKPRRSGVDRDRAVYEALSALIEGRPIPQETIDWCSWYKETFL